MLAAAFRGDLTADWRNDNPNVEPATELLNRIRQQRRQKWEQTELAKAFRGELVPQEPNDEPASVLLERIREQREVAGRGQQGLGKKKATRQRKANSDA